MRRDCKSAAIMEMQFHRCGNMLIVIFIILSLLTGRSRPLVRSSPRSISVNQRLFRAVERSVRLGNRTRLVDVYYEVHYGTLADGVARFLPAQKYSEDWSNVRYRSENRIVCPQNMPPIETTLYNNAETALPSDRASDLYSAYLEQLYVRNSIVPEDTCNCLTMNIYVPVAEQDSEAGDKESSRSLPVVLYVHGDSAMYGSGNWFDAAEFAVSGNTIFVTFNYRLGVLGFFSPSNAQQHASTAIYDLNSAVTWLHENVAAFGGDPGHLTLIGDHRGASLVHAYLLVPDFRSTEMVAKVMLFQSNLLSPNSVVRLAKVREFNDRLLHALRCRKDAPAAESARVTTPRTTQRGKQNLAELLCLANRSTSEIRNAVMNVAAKMGGDIFEYGAASASSISHREQTLLSKSLDKLRRIPIMLITSRCAELDDPRSASQSQSPSDPFTASADSTFRVAGNTELEFMEILKNLERQLSVTEDEKLQEIVRQLVPLYFKGTDDGSDSQFRENLVNLLTDGLSFASQFHFADLLKANESESMANTVFLGELAFRCSSPASINQAGNYFFGFNLNLLFGRNQFGSLRNTVSFIREDVRSRVLSYLYTFVAKSSTTNSASNLVDLWPPYHTNRPEILHFDMVGNRIFKRRISMVESEKVKAWNRVLSNLAENMTSTCAAFHCSSVEFLRGELQKSGSYRNSTPRYFASIYPLATRLGGTATQPSFRTDLTANRSFPLDFNVSSSGTIDTYVQSTLYGSSSSLRFVVFIAIVFAAAFVAINVLALFCVYVRRKRQKSRLKKRVDAAEAMDKRNGHGHGHGHGHSLALPSSDVEADGVNNSADTQFSSLLSSSRSDSQHAVHQLCTQLSSFASDKDRRVTALTPTPTPASAPARKAEQTCWKQLRFETVADSLLHGNPDAVNYEANGSRLQSPSSSQDGSPYSHTLWDRDKSVEGVIENSRVRHKNVTNTFRRFDPMIYSDYREVNETLLVNHSGKEKRTGDRYLWSAQPSSATTML